MNLTVVPIPAGEHTLEIQAGISPLRRALMRAAGISVLVASGGSCNTKAWAVSACQRSLSLNSMRVGDYFSVQGGSFSRSCTQAA
jgi:hypothetical protein